MMRGVRLLTCVLLLSTAGAANAYRITQEPTVASVDFNTISPSTCTITNNVFSVIDDGGEGVKALGMLPVQCSAGKHSGVLVSIGNTFDVGVDKMDVSANDRTLRVNLVPFGGAQSESNECNGPIHCIKITDSGDKVYVKLTYQWVGEHRYGIHEFVFRTGAFLP